MPSDLRTDLLDLAADPAARLVLVLDQAVRVLAAASPAESAALLLFDPSEIQRKLVAAAGWDRRGRTGTAAELFFHRSSAEDGARLEATFAGGRPHRISDPHGPWGPTLSQDCRSSLWLPLAEHHRAVGLLVLEASRPGAFPDAQVRLIEQAAQDALPGLQRGLLRHWLLQLGAPVDVVGRSAAFLDLERQIRLAGSSANGAVLVTGERGSGKELVAWAVHAWSRRRKRPFVPLLGAACAETLTADELFGHERHSFTGAVQARMGKFQMADGGTLLLDEAADLPPSAQAAILRVLERGELQRIGRDEPLRVDVRVVAATNRDLASLMADGRFRHDLFDRLSFFEIRVPPLRDRPDDIPLLARHFLRGACPRTWRSSVFERGGICGTCGSLHPEGCATQDFFHALRAYGWPGNVRELRQTVARLVATVTDEALDLHHLPERVRQDFRLHAPCEEDFWSLDAAVARHIEAALRHSGANQSEAARLLGLPLSTLRSKMKKLGIEPCVV